MKASILSKKYRVTIPKELREKEGWKPGQKFELISRDRGVEFVPVHKSEEVVGIAKDVEPR
jgi:AbrB family looped-hinge helix DNA binding protein